jgi:hypothetical protein
MTAPKPITPDPRAPGVVAPDGPMAPPSFLTKLKAEYQRRLSQAIRDVRIVPQVFDRAPTAAEIRRRWTYESAPPLKDKLQGTPEDADRFGQAIQRMLERAQKVSASRPAAGTVGAAQTGVRLPLAARGIVSTELRPITPLRLPTDFRRT